MRKKVKVNPELLKEELKRFKMLEGYNFYGTKETEPEYKDTEDSKNAELLLGNIDEDDEIPNDTDPTADPAAAPDGGGDDMGNPEAEIAGDLGLDAETPETGEIPEPEAEAPAPPVEEPVDDGIEVDVTSLVKGSEEAKASADAASQNTQALLQKLGDLEIRLAKMSHLSDKIDNLEKEIVVRNPTPVEKLEMRSFDSYPYNQKLSDYWADKEGPYDVMNNNKEKEYVLTKQDLNNNFSEPEIKKSFDVKQSDYEEEDI